MTIVIQKLVKLVRNCQENRKESSAAGDRAGDEVVRSPQDGERLQGTRCPGPRGQMLQEARSLLQGDTSVLRTVQPVELHAIHPESLWMRSEVIQSENRLESVQANSLLFICIICVKICLESCKSGIDVSRRRTRSADSQVFRFTRVSSNFVFIGKMF